MIQQRPGDLLEIEFGGKCYYVVVLSKIVMFGGNIVFAFHGDGSRRSADSLTLDGSGFNICTDLLLPKKEGTVRRLAHLSELERFWKTRMVKASHEHRPERKATKWWIYSFDDLHHEIEVRTTMPREYAEAMDSGMYCFDLVAEKMLTGYTPSKNPCL